MAQILPSTRLQDFKKRHRCLQFLRFDSTIGNLPVAAILGVTITMVGSVFISNGIRVSASVMSEFNDKASTLVASQVVCFCGKWNEECANKCQACWAVFGSLAIFISNLYSIVFFLFSIVCVFIIYND